MKVTIKCAVIEFYDEENNSNTKEYNNPQSVEQALRNWVNPDLENWAFVVLHTSFMRHGYNIETEEDIKDLMKLYYDHCNKI